VEQLVAPLLPWDLPATQFAQEAAPEREYLPLLQTLQEVALSEEALPAAQLAHNPSLVLYFPPVHMVQLFSSAMPATYPTAQALHVTCPTAS
jgi:hypothetical protein